MRLKLPDYTTEAEDLGSREPLLFIHAFPLNRKLWDPQFNELSDVARVLAFDLRGFGGADPVGAQSMEQLADDCNAFLDAMRVSRPVTLCGLSMGGYVAFAFYRKYPGRVRALVLAATRAGPDSEEGRANRDKLAAAVQERGPIAAVETMLPKMFAPRTYETQPELVESVRAMMLAASTPGIVGALRALRDRPDSTPTLAEIKVPTLILHGPEDQLIGLAEAEKMRDGIAGARLQVLPGTGHLLNLEQPAQFNEAVRDFLDSL
ncbi:MAG: alpha/beta hydrolase [Anaerolineales bacterium]|nr:alpha/beta hydrolase [Anaerolineales bacterium]